MPKVCAVCRYESPADAETACPACGAPLGAVPPRSVRGPRDPWERFIAPIALVGVLLLVGVGVWFGGGWLAAALGGGKTHDSSGRIKVGMHISEVGRILDDGPPPSPSYPRMRDYFPADEFGDGTIDYEGDGEVLKIQFVGGCVTSIEESPSSAGPGFHKYTMIVSQR